jgi:photosystem II stability/assembly factor-like uncharacterized protein
MKKLLLFLFVIITFALMNNALAQSDAAYDTSLYNGLEYRCIGPFRGGRSAAVAGVVGYPMRYYFGGTGGGVWKSETGGQSWENISDGFFGGSIGAVEVSEYDPNVIYVGGGEKTVRGNVSHGEGVWKSVDAGKTWTFAGLGDSRHIPRIRIHPKNPDVVYAAALGHLFGSNEERGVYRSSDGGSTWKRILFVNNDVGAVDLEMDPTNPRILFASMWRVRRKPHELSSGGDGSGLWKSVDGGNTWKDISRSDGLPKGTLGIIGITVSPANPNRVWAIIEADDGGVFRSDDGGVKWMKVNEERNLRQRAWYYSRIYADSKNAECVYVLNVQFWKSNDGGKTFTSINTPHGDHHDLWIDPNDPNRMIIGDDGGAQTTYNGGQNWSSYHNQPTAQFYRVAVDNAFPYRIYGGQQDNSSIRIASRTNGGGIAERDWEATAGGESGWIAPSPTYADVVFGGSYQGLLERFDHKTKESRLVDIWPDNNIGHGAKDAKHRFQWNYPLFFSRHDPNVLYAAGNMLFKTTNEGQSWMPISGDLTRNDTSKLGASGGPITKDNTSVEYYCTIFTAVESPLNKNVLWTGSDDGLIHLTRDGGKSWSNVTPPAKLMPEWIQINSIEADPRNEGGLYVAATMYKHDDFRPYIFKTSNLGKNWVKITKGIKETHFTRVVRTDPKRAGLLYAGTERGIYISFDDGANWQSFQRNLPVVPITDLALKDDDLVVATQGRSYWILDDLTSLHQLSAGIASREFHLYAPRPTYAIDAGWVDNPKTFGENPPNGVMMFYYFKKLPDSASVRLTIMQDDGAVIKTYYGKAKEKKDQLPLKVGMNRFVWNMQYPDAETFENNIMWFGGVEGPRALPGNYQARLVVGKDSMAASFTILNDPRSSASQTDLKAQFDFLISVRDKLTQTHRAIKQIREVRKQVNLLAEKVGTYKAADSVKAAGKKLAEKLTAIEEALYQTKNQSGQDPLNYPVRLNNKLAMAGAQAGVGSYRPTEQVVAVRDDVVKQIDIELAKLKTILEQDVAAFNSLVKSSEIPAVVIETQNAKVGTQ